ncbi:MAG: DNA translocase FtsK [Bacteroidetes bacterium]|jgi:DNA segregation ATPase FtsK/SpoIIIE, S-DNA-T family|nr:DNA translocase FtsK [Bacteroidota bacterium]MBT4410389.1 DNA translocase FtsK [Bacteroidota bacterium]MBT7092445.1 DNA translocase FtsK [Bacteroidota bacterium]MBT7464227.1 DNA translocase FtsK [Bacteroidota bacterium]
MAKQKRKPAKKAKKKRPIRKKFDTRVKVVLGLLCLFIALFTGIAMISFIFTWQADQSFLDQARSATLANPDIQVENWAGKAGAIIGNIFIYKWFGISSLAFVFLIVLLGFELIGTRLMLPWRTLKYTILIIIWSSITLAHVFGEDVFLLGGGHGKYISEWLTALLGPAGIAAFIIVSGLVIIVFLFRITPDLLRPREKPEVLFDEDEFTDASDKKEEFVVSDKQNNQDPNNQDIISQIDNLQVSKTVNENDQISVDFNPDIAELNPSAPPPSTEGDTPDPADPEMTIDHASDRKEELIKKNHPTTNENYDPTQDLSSYKFPGLDLLRDHTRSNSKVSDEELISNKNRIVQTLGNYKIKIEKIKATIGPTITLYEIIPAPGVRISKIKSLEDDIALSLSALGIRIIAPIPGRGTIGIEVPNRKPEVVSMHSLLASKKFQDSSYELPIAMGKTISNETFMLDLARMPHLLVAGATGQGKSVGLNVIIASILYKKHPSEVKFVLIDPKKVELTLYTKLLHHYLAVLPDVDDAIITETQQVIQTLNSLSVEMDDRYNLLKAAEVRNIKEYNQKFVARRLNPEKGHRYLPYFVVIIDEFADLIMTAGKEIELPLTRIAQLARAVGIHMVIATQRPSTNIITGTIKANFPGRIAFRVSSMIDSRTILDSPGANHLVGRGDMLISQGADLERLQCAFIDTPEVEAITQHISNQRGYPQAWLLPEPRTANEEEKGQVNMDKLDDLFEDAARLLVTTQQGSTSSIQRKFSIGYNRAGRIMDQLEAAGVVGPVDGSKPRQVLFQDAYSLEKFLNDQI